MKRFRVLKIFIVILIGIAAIHYAFFRAPSESQMLANFKEHKIQLEQLRSMLQQDRKVQAIAFDWFSGTGVPDDSLKSAGISQQRLDAYRKLMKIFGVSLIGRLGGKKGYFKFAVFGGGMTDTSWSIGYAWSEDTPSHIVKSAYNTVYSGWCHSPIEGHWYIYHMR
jgi:hypothetical protein